MGSLCGSSGATTTQQSSSTPTGFPLLADIYNRVSNVASQPYTPYGGQMVAGLSGTQQAGIQGVTNAQGAAQPYFDQAANYARTGAEPISSGDINRYMSPYTQNVIDATRANFQQDNAIGQQQVIGNAAAKGALGGDRVGVAQAELRRQQKLAQDPVIAGMYGQSYDKALGAAQQDRAAQAQGAYTFGALAPSVQNARISGAQAQIGAGGLEQGTQQAQLTADYNKYLQQLAFPYQQAGFLASAGLPAVNAMGGTATGQTTTPGPNPLGQVAGLGLTAASFLKDGGVVKGYAGGGPVGLFDIDTYVPKYSGAQSMSPYGQAPALPKIGAPQASGFNPTVGQVGGAVNGIKSLFGSSFMPEGGMYDANMAGAIPSSVTGMVGGGLRRGGRVSGHPMIFRSGGRVHDKHAKFHATVHAIRQTLRGGGPVHGYADGGSIRSESTEHEIARRDADRAARPMSIMGRMVWPEEAHIRDYARSPYMRKMEAAGGYAAGGDVTQFDDAFSPFAVPPDNTPQNRALALSMGDKYQPEGSIELNAGAPMPRPRPFEAPGVPVGSIPSPDDGGLPPQITGAPGMPAQAMAHNGVPQSPYAPPPTDVSSSSPAPSGASAAPPAPTKGLFGNPFGLSDETRTALLSAGLGTLASRSPFALSALGEGGLQGIKSYTEQKASKQKIDSEARKLAQQAEQFAQNLGLHREQLDVSERRADLAEKRADLPPGYRWNADHTAQEAIPGGVADPKTIEAQTKAKRTSTMTDNAIEIAARQLNQGDASALQNVGRGTQGDEKLTAIKNRAAQILVDEGGMKPAEAATHISSRVQEFRARGIGLSAEARTAANREANLNIILKATEAAIPAALEASRAVSRTGWVPINKIIQSGQVIASNPELREFGMANLQLAEHWARAMNPTGVMRESDRDKALEFLSTADSQPTYERAVNQLHKQIKREQAAVASMRPVVPGGHAPSEAPPATTTSALPKAVSKAEYDKLPSKAKFIGPDGKEWTKP